MTYPALPLLILYIGIGLTPQLALAEDALPESLPAESRGSNVLFLPGIKGSRLYDDAGQKLWEPFGNHDVDALMLDEEGKSTRDDVHVEPGDIMDSVAIFTDIYGSYMHFMDGLVEDGTINTWTPVAYDWRLSLPDIVNAGTDDPGPMPMSLRSYGIPPIREILENLVQDSKTGKVTVIAHSNGGLVAKELMLALGDDETARLIDKVIFIGVPQSGAPQALGALLYGYKEGLPWWFPGIVSTATARQFAENSPMGYHLLPSSTYFKDADDAHTVVRFDAEHAYTEERASYASTIESVTELRSFALAEDGGREKPDPSNYHDANVLNEGLLDYAQSIHEEIDAWRPPPGVSVYQIAGWGEDTVAGIEYYERCILLLCKEMYRPTFVEDGDGVVPAKSALMIPESDTIENFWFDLLRHNDESSSDHDHGNLLASDEVRSHVLHLLTDSEDVLPEYISQEEPIRVSERDRFMFFLHSPLTLEIHDTEGNRTGLDADEIPGAEYGEFGDVKFVSARAAQNYRLELRGYDSGTFTLEIQKFEGDEKVMERVFGDLPVTPKTIAKIDVGTEADSVGPLLLDIDGDGSFDQSIDPYPEGPGEIGKNTRTENSPQRRRVSQVSNTPTLEALLLELRSLLQELLLQLETRDGLHSGKHVPILHPSSHQSDITDIEMS